ncbi:MAG: hypothetical protein J6S82_05170, partial [Bacteroidales bacterium]|nr:hypothetical protein [Bacteroidales bacterium]
MKILHSFRLAAAALLALCLLPLQQIRAQQTLIIGSSSKAQYNVTQFDSLLKEIAAGNLAGQLVMAFESGTYPITNALVVNSAKFTAKDHLTITSVAKNRDSVIFSYNGSIAAVQLNSTQNVTFSHITISSTKTSGCHAVGINGPVSNVLFYQCAIAAPATGTAGSCCPIGTASATAATDKGSITATVDQLHFVGNIISGGCRGIWLNGSATNHLTNIRIDSNKILNSYDVDANITYCDTVSFVGNLDIPRPGINGNHYGITLSNCVVESFSGNFINYAGITQATHTGVVLTLSNCTPASGKRFPVVNNVVIGKTAIGYKTSMGHVVSMSNLQADILHNSIFNDRVTTNATYSVNCLNLTGATSDVNVIGNMLVTIDSSEFPLRIDTTTGAFFTDYNNYWSNNGFLARDNSNNYRSMAAVQAFTNGDKYSLSIAPLFSDATQGLKLDNPAPFTIVPNPGVTEDCQGLTRGKTTTIGAYAVASLDAALTDFGKTDFNATGSGSNDLYLTIMNGGLTTLTSATIYWNDGSAVQKYAWSGKLALGDKDSVKVGTFKAVAGTMCHLKAWVADPNSGKDEFAGNDTIDITKYICNGQLAGDYTVGKGMDFATLDDAMFILNNCGVKAPVRLLMAGGTFGSTTIEGTVPGTSSANTITLMPYKNDTVIFDGGSAGASLLVSNAAHWIFQGLTIGNTNNGLRGVDLNGSLEDITFHGCGIYSSLTATSNTYRCVNLPNTSTTTTYPTDLRFIGNRIEGGYYNFYLYYTAGSDYNNMKKASVYIDSNILANAYYYGVYSYYRSAIKSFCHNTIENRSNTSSNYYGLYGTQYGVWNRIVGNRIRISNTNTAYGINMTTYQQYGQYCDSTPAYIYNNEVVLTGSGTKYGIYVSSPNGNWEVHYNTVYTKSSGTAYGL